MHKGVKTLYCRECGAEVYSNEKKCWNCNAKIKNSRLGYILLVLLSLVLVSIIGYMYLVGYDTMYNKGVTKTSKKYEKKIEELNSSHATELEEKVEELNSNHATELEETYKQGKVDGVDAVEADMMKIGREADWELYQLNINPGVEVLDVSMSKLYEDFASDPLAFEDNYQDYKVRVRVTGTISAVDKGEGSLSLVDGNNTIDCSVEVFYLYDEQLEVGKNVTVEGFVMCEPSIDISSPETWNDWYSNHVPTSFHLINCRIPPQ